MTTQRRSEEGDRVLGLRARLGWTQQELADALGIDVRTIRRWEAGETQPSGLARRQLDRLVEHSAPRRPGRPGKRKH